MPQKARYESVVPVRLTQELAQKLDTTVRVLRYRSRNELIREAVEAHIDRLMSARIVEVKEVSVAQARGMIEEYVSEHPGAHHVSEISEALGIELGTAFKAVEALVQERKVRAKA